MGTGNFTLKASAWNNYKEFEAKLYIRVEEKYNERIWANLKYLIHSSVSF